MSDFETLIDAVERGAVEEVKAILQRQPELIRQRDEIGATALHHVTFAGHRAVALFLIEHGADVNATDARYHATPAGWAIEYLREAGAFLGIELNDLAFAIERGDVEWVARFLKRFPGLRHASNRQGVPFKTLASQSGNSQIISLFTAESGSVT